MTGKARDGQGSVRPFHFPHWATIYPFSGVPVTSSGVPHSRAQGPSAAFVQTPPSSGPFPIWLFPSSSGKNQNYQGRTEAMRTDDAERSTGVAEACQGGPGLPSTLWSQVAVPESSGQANAPHAAAQQSVLTGDGAAPPEAAAGLRDVPQRTARTRGAH